MPPIRILLVDDHSLFRESLSRLLAAEPEFRVVGTCASTAEASAVLDRDGADVRGEEQNTQPLSTRERAVLKSVFEGLTNKEIAANLQISESSVKAVLQQLFDKTGVRTRSQLVRIAIEQHAADWLTEP